ncbi:MAG: hypothetical protein KDB26_09880 [Microthrixaceae bacterium]|nr:hypothetical protein [Microthrixaceae bacterium]
MLLLDPNDIVACFDPYRPDGYSSERATEGLHEHIADPWFRADPAVLVDESPLTCDTDSAGTLVTDAVLRIV